MVQEHLRVEVAPAELATERLRTLPRPARDPFLDLAHGDVAEVDVRGELRGAAGQAVMALGVVLHRPREEALEAPARLGLARGDRLRELGRQPEVGEPRQVSEPHPGGHGHLSGRPVHRASLLLSPCPVKRREDGERSAVLRADLPDVGAEVARRRDGAHSDLLEGGAGRAVARAGVGRDVAGQIDRFGADLDGQRRDLPRRSPFAYDEPAAALAQGAFELGQRLEQELRPARRGEATTDETAVEDERGHDVVVRGERAHQRRVVVHAQIAPEPDDGDGRHRFVIRAWPARGIFAPVPA